MFNHLRSVVVLRRSSFVSVRPSSTDGTDINRHIIRIVQDGDPSTAVFVHPVHIRCFLVWAQAHLRFATPSPSSSIVDAGRRNMHRICSPPFVIDHQNPPSASSLETIRTRIVDVHDTITVIVQVVVHIPLHPFHDECKSYRIHVTSTSMKDIPSDDINVKVR